MRLKKLAEQAGDRKDSSYYDRIKENAARDRENTRKMREEYDSMKRLIDQTIQIPKKQEVKALTKENLEILQNPQENEEYRGKVVKAKQKTVPKWAYTSDKCEEKEEEECEGLIEFMNGLDYQEYIEDYEVKSMVAALKNRIKDMQKESVGINREKARGENARGYGGKAEDGLSQLSNYEAKSVASERSQSSFV